MNQPKFTLFIINLQIQVYLLRPISRSFYAIRCIFVYLSRILKALGLCSPPGYRYNIFSADMYYNRVKVGLPCLLFHRFLKVMYCGLLQTGWWLEDKRLGVRYNNNEIMGFLRLIGFIMLSLSFSFADM